MKNYIPPKYHKLRKEIYRQIEEGEWKVGENIPPERELAEIHNISRVTVRNALDELVYEGILHREQGRGTFVVEPSTGKRGNKEETTRTIALCLYDVGYIADPYFSIIARGVGKALEEKGYHLHLKSTTASRIKNNNVQGIIILDQSVPDSEVVNIAKKVPVVLIDRYIYHPNISSVSVDNYKGIFTATEHLISLAHQRIAFFVENFHFFKNQQMIKGFHEALKKYGISFQDSPIEELVSNDSKHLVPKMIKLIKKFSPTALLISHDKTACIILKILKDIGCDVPSQISIMGYNDEPMAHLVSPSLSTIQVPLEELGREAGKILISRINGEKRSTKILETKLLVRNSTVLARNKGNRNKDLKSLENLQIAEFAANG